MTIKALNDQVRNTRLRVDKRQAFCLLTCIMMSDRPLLGDPIPQQRQVPQQRQMPQQRQTQQGPQNGQRQSQKHKKRDVSQQVLCPPERFISVPTSDLQEAFRGTNVVPHIDMHTTSEGCQSRPCSSADCMLCRSSIFRGRLRSIHRYLQTI